ncbi:MAG: hypothetical protein U1E25_15935 [Methylocystis sp.]
MIYAVGGVQMRFNLTPVAIREEQAFADSVFGATPTTVDYEHTPSAVFDARLARWDDRSRGARPAWRARHL